MQKLKQLTHVEKFSTLEKVLTAALLAFILASFFVNYSI